MFTGHVRELGHIDGFDGPRVRVRAPGSVPAIEPGGAVCVSGVRLTVESTGGDVFTAAVAGETRHRTTLGELRAGDPAEGRPCDPQQSLGRVRGSPNRASRLLSLNRVSTQIRSPRSVSTTTP